MAGHGRGGRERAPARRRRPRARRPIETSLGRDEYIHAVEVAKDAIAAGEAIQVVLARRQSFDLPTDPATGAPLDGIGLYRALRRVNPSPYLFFVRTPDLRGRRRVAGAAAPGRGRQADDPPDRRHAAARRRRPRGRAARRGAPARPEGAGRARDARRPRAERPRAASRGAGTVTVSKYMEVERYSHVLHLVSHVEARLKPELDALDALRSVFPAGTLSGAPEGPGDAAHRRGRGRAPRAVRRRRRLPRLRRQPRHRDHHPERGPQGRPGPRPHGRRDRRRVRPRERSSRRPSTRPPPSGAPSSWRPASPRRRRRRARRRARRPLEADEAEARP